jgi:hypothetical protein
VTLPFTTQLTVGYSLSITVLSLSILSLEAPAGYHSPTSPSIEEASSAVLSLFSFSHVHIFSSPSHPLSTIGFSLPTSLPSHNPPRFLFLLLLLCSLASPVSTLLFLVTALLSPTDRVTPSPLHPSYSTLHVVSEAF